jgi:hypothetical protein
MARTTVTQITSDLTGNEYKGEDYPPVKVTVAGADGKPVSGNLDLTPGDHDALIAFVQGDGSKLRKLLAGDGKAPAKPASKSGSGQAKHSPDEIQGAKDHMAASGRPYSGKGKIPNWAFNRTEPPAADPSPEDWHVPAVITCDECGSIHWVIERDNGELRFVCVGCGNVLVDDEGLGKPWVPRGMRAWNACMECVHGCVPSQAPCGLLSPYPDPAGIPGARSRMAVWAFCSGPGGRTPGRARLIPRTGRNTAMAARRKRRKIPNWHHPALAFVLILAVMLGWEILAHIWILLALSGIPLAYLAGRKQDRLYIRKLRAQLEAARESAQLVWDASASYDAAGKGSVWNMDAVSPYPTDVTKAQVNQRYGNPSRDNLINDPRSGAGPLTSGE